VEGEPVDWKSWSEGDWRRLQELREGFLQGVRENYWQTRRDLALYDAVFGERIAWKWAAVLSACAQAGIVCGGDTVWDWGCGSGVGGRLVAEFLRAEKVVVTDRSPLAVEHAAAGHREWGRAILPPPGPGGCVLVLSHLVGELDTSGWAELSSAFSAAGMIFWVEPGDRKHGQLLASARDDLLTQGWEVLLPCPHQKACPASAARTAHWCHFFARPPSTAFQSAFWQMASKRLGIDRRSLPLSFLVLRKSGAAAVRSPECRILGRPTLRKGYAEVLLCRSNGLLEEARVTKKTSPSEFRSLRKEVGFPGLWPTVGDEPGA
jgi:hypothetical protein